MIDKLSYDELIAIAAQKLKCQPKQIKFHAWYQSFGSTAGPHRGVIAGSAFTDFQVLGFSKEYSNEHIMYCAGLWQEWSGRVGEQW